MWKKLKTKSDRKKKNFQSFRSLCCLTDNNSDLFQNCWLQQQGKNTIFVVQQFSSSHVGWNLDQTETLQLWLSQPADSVYILVPVSSLAVTFLNLSSDISQTSLQVSVERCIRAGMTRCPRAAAVMQHVSWHELLLLLLRKDSSRGSCLSVWNCN